jgi:hypothetical protein
MTAASVGGRFSFVAKILRTQERVILYMTLREGCLLVSLALDDASRRENFGGQTQPELSKRPP